MKRFFNALIVIFILFVGNYFWPEAIAIDSTKTLIIVGITYLIADYLFAGAIVGISSILAITMNAFLIFAWGIMMFGLAILWVPIKLWLLSSYIPGFSIIGTITWIVLSILILSFTIEKKAEIKKISC